MNLLRAHGSPTLYLYRRGCRCASCCAANSEKTRRFRDARPGYHPTWAREHLDRAVEHQRRYKEAHPERVAETARRYRESHREQLKQRRTAYRAEHIEETAAYRAEHREQKAAYYVAHREEQTARARNLKYNLLPGEWDAMFSSQGERCKCCGDDDPGSKHGWCTDHDHESGAVRGILCHGCNTGLGRFRDDPERLMAAIEYLAAATL